MMLPVTRHRSKDPTAGWLITFADLMTLLLTFFILLLSFSNIDAQKYKMIANAMAQSFGVSWIQGHPPPAVIEIPVEVPVPVPATTVAVENLLSPAPEVSPPAGSSVAGEQTGLLAEGLIQDLSVQIEEKKVAIEYDKEKVIVRFSQEASFPTGSARLKEGMDRVLERVAKSLTRCEGNILVSGYTDDQPIVSPQFRSNWDLSAARAVSVVHALLNSGWLDPERLTAAGHAQTHALVPNDTEAGRALNRRVEIKVYNPSCQAPE